MLLLSFWRGLQCFGASKSGKLKKGKHTPKCSEALADSFLVDFSDELPNQNAWLAPRMQKSRPPGTGLSHSGPFGPWKTGKKEDDFEKDSAIS